MPLKNASIIGPVLILDDVENGHQRLAALFIVDGRDEPPPVGFASGAARAVPIAQFDHATIWRVRFSMPADRPSEYQWDEDIYEFPAI